MDYLLVTVFGLIIGSFLSVCIYRIPIAREADEPEETEPLGEGELDLDPTPLNLPPNIQAALAEGGISISKPARSLCPRCGNQLKAWHNIPLISYLLLAGKCAYCRNRISARYPTVELLSALSAVAAYLHFGFTPTAFLVFAFTAALIVISFIDYDFYIIPNVISLPGIVLGLLVSLINQFSGFFTAPVVANVMGAVYGILAGGGFLFLVSELFFLLRKKEGLGMGDVKLLAMTGAFFGYEASLYTIFVGSVLGSIFGVVFAIVGRKKLSKPMPFGPYLAVATIFYLFIGMEGTLLFVEGLVGAIKG